MVAAASPTRIRTFWKVLKVWGGIMTLPGAWLTFQAASSEFRSASFYNALVLMLAYYVFAPGLAFGTLGAAAMTLLVRPGQLLRAYAVGILVGFMCPAAFFAALFFYMPKDEGSLGWFLFGAIFSMTGVFAGSVAATALAFETRS